MIDERNGALSHRSKGLGIAGVDEGVRSYMLRVYNYMGLGLALSGAIAFYVANSPALLASIYGSALKWVFLAGWLGLGFFSHKLFFSRNQALGQVAYWSYAVIGGVLVGGMIAPFLAGFGGGPLSVVRALGITAIAFLGMSILGYSTKRDLSALGGFLAMATIGLLVAMLVNAFLIGSSGFDLLISCVVVLVFAALMAYETQQIKHMYQEKLTAGQKDQAAVFGAFLLYGSFIVMFMHVLNILGFISSD